MLKPIRHGHQASPFRGSQAMNRLRLTANVQLDETEHRDTLYQWCRICRRDTRHVAVASDRERLEVLWCYGHRGEPPAAVTV